MAYVDAAKYNKVKSTFGYPVGTIINWSGTEDTIPTGWKICNGSYLNVTAYPKLYNCIGITYGGTLGSTFRLPDISGKGIVDIFIGHYSYLKSSSSTYPSTSVMGGLNTDAWTPIASRSISQDPYWSQIGQANNGDSGSGFGNPTPSSIDLIGVIDRSMPGLTATVSELALTSGTLQRGYVIMPRKLGDGHIPVHTHTFPVADGGEISHTQGSRACPTGKSNIWNSPCRQSDQSSTGKFTRDFRNVTGGAVNHYVPGGGNTTATTENAGNGFSGGDQLAHVGGTKYWHTSISAEFRTWDSIGGHTHGSNTITFTSGLSVRSSNTYTDIVSSNVNIDNTPGLDAGIINMTSTCPSLTMLFIIKVF